MKERFWMWLAWKLPVRLVYWCIVRAASIAEPVGYPGDVTAAELLRAVES